MSESQKPAWPPIDAHAAVSMHGNSSGQSDDHGAEVAAPTPPAPAPVVAPMTDGGPGIPPAPPAQPGA